MPATAGSEATGRRQGRRLPIILGPEAAGIVPVASGLARLEKTMPYPSVFVTRQIPEAGLRLLRQEAEVEVWPERLPPPYELLLEKAARRAGNTSSPAPTDGSASAGGQTC